MKFLILILLISGFLLPFIQAGSSTEASFIIPGCTLPSGAKVARDTCAPITRDYYCTFQDIAYKTINNPQGGSWCNGTDAQYGTPDDCCPVNYRCTAGGCVLRTSPCENFDNDKAKCEENGCVYIFNGAREVCRDKSSLSCSDYRSNLSCAADSMSLGQIGYGTEMCRTNAYAGSKIVSNCRCKWTGSAASGNCSLVYDLQDALFMDNPVKFSCEKNFTTGECLNGQQKISWTSAITDREPADYQVTEQEKILSGCTDDTSTLACGEKLVKLPFFTWFNFLLAGITLVIFYIFYRKH